MKSQVYLEFLKRYLEKDPDALLWVLGYATYCHAIDDIIDEEIPKDKIKNQFILETFEFAESIYTNIFYLNNINTLRPLIKMASQTYMDSVQFENSTVKWQRDYSDVLRTMGNEVILAVVEIVNGTKIRHQASLELREISYNTHHDSLGNPV